MDFYVHTPPPTTVIFILQVCHFACLDQAITVKYLEEHSYLFCTSDFKLLYLQNAICDWVSQADQANSVHTEPVTFTKHGGQDRKSCLLSGQPRLHYWSAVRSRAPEADQREKSWTRGWAAWERGLDFWHRKSSAVWMISPSCSFSVWVPGLAGGLRSHRTRCFAPKHLPKMMALCVFYCSHGACNESLGKLMQRRGEKGSKRESLRNLEFSFYLQDM